MSLRTAVLTAHFHFCVLKDHHKAKLWLNLEMHKIDPLKITTIISCMSRGGQWCLLFLSCSSSHITADWKKAAQKSALKRQQIIWWNFNSCEYHHWTQQTAANSPFLSRFFLSWRLRWVSVVSKPWAAASSAAAISGFHLWRCPGQKACTGPVVYIGGFWWAVEVSFVVSVKCEDSPSSR